MERLRRTVKFQVGFLIFLLFLCSVSSFTFPSFIVKAQPSTVYIDSSFLFGFNNGYMQFATSQTFLTVYDSGNYWYFDNVGISLDGSNATINSWIQNNQTVLNLTSISNPTTILMNISALNPSVTVSGATSYSVANGILTITKSSFTRAIITINLSPIIVGNFAVSSFDLAQNVPFYMNATVYDEWGINYLSSFTFEFSGEYQVEASWSLGAWTLPFGSSACQLITSGCSVSQTNSSAYQFAFEFMLTASSPEDSVDVLNAGTAGSDSLGNAGSGSIVNLATYSGTPQGPGGLGPGNNPPPTNQTNPTNSTSPTNSTNPGNTGNNTNTNPFPNIPPVTVTLPFSPEYLLLGIVAIFGIVGYVGYYSGKRRRDPLREARKEFRKQTEGKPIIWNKDQD